VIHAGVYYQPGSLKATMCKAGSASMVEFCKDHGLPYEICGKLIVATDESELPRLRDLHERPLANGLPVRMRRGGRSGPAWGSRRYNTTCARL
jgi:L-2-hydroxyglutarate oxidase